MPYELLQHWHLHLVLSNLRPNQQGIIFGGVRMICVGDCL